MKKKNLFKEFLNEEMKDPEFKKGFDREEVFSSIAIQIAKIRQKRGFTQNQLAKLTKTSQQAISRIENENYEGYSLKTLQKISQVLDKKLIVKFV